MAKKQPIPDPFENAKTDVVGFRKLGARGSIGKDIVGEELAELSQQNSKLIADLETAQSTIEELKKQLDEAKSNQSQFEIEADIEGLHKQIDALTDEKSTLKSENENLLQKVAKLEAENKDLKKSNKDLKNQADTAPPSPTVVGGIDVESLMAASLEDIQAWVDSIDFTTTDKITLNNIPLQFKLDFQLCSGQIGALARQRVNQYDLQVAAVLLHNRLIHFLMENSPDFFTSVSARSAYEYGDAIRKRLLAELELALRVLQETRKK